MTGKFIRDFAVFGRRSEWIRPLAAPRALGACG
jgi:hypothetical protein